ncbi:MAG: hypothetical protein IPP90_12240 [Gemmatimonadaceae bacterium]|nr:hypothetical protein [Gemmatimonadaceae bacterium]
MSRRWALCAQRFGIAFGVAVSVAEIAHAQGISPTCTVTPTAAGSAADVCRKASDLFAFVVPQVGVALAGGNHVLGEGGTLGGWGKRTVTLRVTAVDGRLPKNTVPLTLSRSAAVADDFGADRVPVPMPSLDAAIGLLAGLPMGVTNVGGVDVLLGVIGSSAISSGKFGLKPQGSRVALSYGVRVGALQESSFVPGLSVSWVRRKVPTLDLDYTPANDTLLVRNMSLTANTLRIVASKRFVLFGVAAGVGRDEIQGVSGLQAVVNEAVLGTPTRATITFPTLKETVRRNTAFVNASFGVPLARLVAEYGRSSAGTLRETLNAFGGRRANETYAYGSVGVTVRF